MGESPIVRRVVMTSAGTDLLPPAAKRRAWGRARPGTGSRAATEAHCPVSVKGSARSVSTQPYPVTHAHTNSHAHKHTHTHARTLAHTDKILPQGPQREREREREKYRE